MDSELQTREVDENYDFFQRNLVKFLHSHKDEYALLRSREIVGFYENPGQAFAAGREKFADGIFSIQEVTDEPIDLGFFSHAGA